MNAFSPNALLINNQSPFTLPNQTWQQVYDYVQSVSGLSNEVITPLLSAIPNLPALKTVCTTWRNSTYAGILALAKQMQQYATNVVPKQYGDLETLLTRIDASQSASNQEMQNFQGIMTLLIADATAMQKQATALLPSTQAIVLQSQLAYQSFNDAGGIGGVIAQLISSEMGRNPGNIQNYEQAIQTAVNEVGQAIQALANIELASVPYALAKIQGGWQAISDDLTNVQQWIQTQINIKQPFVSELALDVAQNEWQSLAQELNAFLQTAP